MHSLQCLCDQHTCFPVLPKQLVICCFLRFQQCCHIVVSTHCSCVLVQVELKFSLNGNCANVYTHVVVTCEHVWCTVCSLCTNSTVLPSPSQATHNLLFLEVSAVPSCCCFKLLFVWTGMGWIEYPTEWNLYKCVCTCSGALWACLVHSLQCLHDWHTCCLSLPKQLVICCFLRFQQHCHIVVSSCCSCVLVQVVLKFSLNRNCANVYMHVVEVCEHV